MKNLRISAYGALLLTAMMSTGLQAQDAGFAAGASLLKGQGRTLDQVGVETGMNLWGAYTFKTEMGFSFRPGIGLNLLLGAGVQGVYSDADARAAGGSATYPDPVPINVPGSSLRHTFTNEQIFSDFVVPIFKGKADWIIGLSANFWTVKVTGARPGEYSPVDLDSATRTVAGTGFIRTGDANGTKKVPGTKLGLRFGFDYKLSEKAAMQVLFQSTELGRMAAKAGQMPTLNPAWIEAGISYKF